MKIAIFLCLVVFITNASSSLSPAKLRFNSMCRLNPFAAGCLKDTDFTVMIERMEPGLFKAAVNFAKEVLDLEIPVAVLEFGQSDNPIKCGWFGDCMKSPVQKKKNQLNKLAGNPPTPEIARVAYAIDFGTEFSVADRTGGRQGKKNVFILIGSGKFDQSETQADFNKAEGKALRLGFTVIYINLGFSPRFRRSVGANVDEAIKKGGGHAVDIAPKDLTPQHVWDETKTIIYPESE